MATLMTPNVWSQVQEQRCGSIRSTSRMDEWQDLIKCRCMDEEKNIPYSDDLICMWSLCTNRIAEPNAGFKSERVMRFLRCGTKDAKAWKQTCFGWLTEEWFLAVLFISTINTPSNRSFCLSLGSGQPAAVCWVLCRGQAGHVRLTIC